ncbi:TonB-dependent receptor [Pedobacter sp. L105]|uniref:SusC/RagA family TonB-linked outer membrane protein n=1 Tax=Pedobacter sp. L105 TaxID=1641871 RepID=UPI00131EB5BC|nr:TonB-dependent receptor [Pedobacter sp. L105]
MGKILQAVSLLFAMIVMSSSSVFAQSRTITGTVYDEKGVSLIGVSVTVKGSKISAGTDVNGKYAIAVPAGSSTLVFSFIGSLKQEVVTGSRTTINVTMKSSVNDLSEVVVVGYGTQKRGDVNGSISSVKASDIANIPQVSADQLLQGKVAGVTVTQNSGSPGSQTSVHIRGVTSLSLSNEPLYVIDGVPISGDATNSSTSGQSVQLSQNNSSNAVSPLSMINPSDIETIDVLKDASATAIYGARASNGVIIITTKHGKNGTARIAYDGYYGIQQQGKFLDMMNLQQYAGLENTLADLSGVARRGEFADPSLLGAGTDWQKAIFRTAGMQSHQVSISGGKDGTDYYISGGYLQQDGTIIGTDYQRYSFHTSVNSQVKDWFKVGTTLSGSHSDQNATLGDNTGIIYNALLSAPDQAVYNADGSFAGPQSTTQGTINPVAQARNQVNNLLRSNVNGSVYAEIKFIKDLTLRSELNGDFNESTAKLYNPTYAWGAYINTTAKLTEYLANSSYVGWKEYLTYNHTFAEKHALTALVGYELSKSTWGGVTSGVSGFTAGDSPNNQTLNNGTASTATNGEYKGDQELESAFARAIYTFNNKYSLTATIRADRSSKFADGHQTGYFPSFAAGWKLSDEPFMADVKQYVDNIKIRAGYGEVGNQNVANYKYGTALTAVSTGLGTGFVVDKVANANLTWESAKQTDIGADFSVVNGRVSATFDYFNKTSKNFIFQANLPAYLLGGSAEYSTQGVVGSPFINGGQISNKGFDFSINSKNIDGKNFKWSTSVVFSHYKNMVNSLAAGTPYIDGTITVSYLSLPVTRTVVGGPVGEFYGYKVKDIFKTTDQLKNAPTQFDQPVANASGGTWLGDVQYVDVNGDGKITSADQTALGSPNPTFTYGITNNFSYKSFDLSIFLNGSYGAKIFNALKYSTEGLSGLYTNQLAEAANYWTPSNPNSNIPAPKIGDNPNLYNSNRFLESGSFLRIQNVQLGYTLPADWVKRIKLNRLKVYVSGQNLYVFTKYSGLDPEVGAFNQNVFLTNVDMGRYPIARTITFGINAEF